jgi:hypothetical protein
LEALSNADSTGLKNAIFLLYFATTFSPFSGIGLGLPKLSPAMTMR